MPESTYPLGVLAFLIFFLPSMHGQQSSNVAGGDAAGTGGSFSYSIGQVAYTAQSGTGGMSSHGVQQAYLEIMVSNEDVLGGISIRLFPNPSASYTLIALDAFTPADMESFSYQLFDVYGHFLNSGKIQSSLHSIAIGDLIGGMYILKVYYQNQPIKTFRFIKTE